MRGSDQGIKLGSTDGKVIGIIQGNLYGITLRLDVGRDIYSLYESFDGYNDGKLEGLFSGDSLVSTDSKLIGFDKASN